MLSQTSDFREISNFDWNSVRMNGFQVSIKHLQNNITHCVLARNQERDDGISKCQAFSHNFFKNIIYPGKCIISFSDAHTLLFDISDSSSSFLASKEKVFLEKKIEKVRKTDTKSPSYWLNLSFFSKHSWTNNAMHIQRFYEPSN